MMSEYTMKFIPDKYQMKTCVFFKEVAEINAKYLGRIIWVYPPKISV